MEKNLLRRIRRDSLGINQTEFGELLGVSQQVVSEAERRELLPESLEEAIRTRLVPKFPDKREDILELLDSRWRLSEGDLYPEVPTEEEKTDWETLQVDPIEYYARPWALTYRTTSLLDRLEYLAYSAGLRVHRLTKAYGLELTALGRLSKNSDRRRNTSGLEEFQHPGATKFCIPSGTVVLLGAPRRHPVARKVFEILREYLDVDIQEFENIPFYFGYATILKAQRVKNDVYHPSRYIDQIKGKPRQYGLCYEDYGFILTSPISYIAAAGHNPFNARCERLMLVSGLHRLATGIGIRLLEDRDLRKLAFRGREHNFESDEEVGVTAYRVLLQFDGRPQLKAVELLDAWSMRPPSCVQS